MFLGLDLGTTNVKAVLAAPDGRIAAAASRPVRIDHLPDGGAEQDIEDIWHATCDALADLASANDLSNVQAVGVSSQGGAIQIQTADRKPVGPVISWLDGRGRPFDEQLNAELGRQWFAQRIGHGGSGITLGQVLRRRAAGALPEGFRVGFVGDVIVSRLCGRAAHDASSLSLGMLYNPALRAADPDVLARLDLTESRLPDLIDIRTPAGPLLADVADAASLPAGIPVSAAIHDQYAAALGCGAVHAGDVMFGAGTAWVLLAVADRLAPPAINAAFVCTHPVEGLYGQILSLTNGGSAMQWAARTLGMKDVAPAQLEQMIRSAPPGCDGVRFRPLLATGGGAHLPADAAGALTGLRLACEPRHILRAVAEGLALELARYLDLIPDASAPPRRLIMCGGAAAGDTTPQIIADTTNLPILCLAEPATSALGAAITARALIDPTTDLAALAEHMTPATRTVTPGTNRALYADLLAEYLTSLPRE